MYIMNLPFYLKHCSRTRTLAMVVGAWFLSLTWLNFDLWWHSIAKRGVRTVTHNKRDTELCIIITWFKIPTIVLNFYVLSIIMLWYYTNIDKVVKKHYQ